MRHILIPTLLIFFISCQNRVDNKGKTEIRIDTLIAKELTKENPTFNIKDKIKFYPSPKIEKVILDSSKIYKEYWAMFIESDGQFLIKKIQARRVMIDEIMEIYGFYTDINNPLYIFEGIEYNQDVLIKGDYPQKYPILPRDTISFNLLHRQVRIFAEGTKEEYIEKKSRKLEMLIDYNLHFVTIDSNIKDEKILFKQDTILPIGTIRYKPCFGIEWIGDIDLDGKVDLIMKYSDHHCCEEYRLFLSSIKEINNTDDYIAKIGFGN